MAAVPHIRGPCVCVSVQVRVLMSSRVRAASSRPAKRRRVASASPAAAQPPSPSSAQPAHQHVGNNTHCEVRDMTDSSPLLAQGAYALMRERLYADGYLLLRGVVPAAAVVAARSAMLAQLQAQGALCPKADVQEGVASSSGVRGGGWTVDAPSGQVMERNQSSTHEAHWQRIANSRTLRDVYQAKALHSLFQQLLSTSSVAASSSGVGVPPSFVSLGECTWLRAKAPGGVTAEHVDYFYFYQHKHIFQQWYSPCRWPTQQQAHSLLDQFMRGRGLSRAQRRACQVCREDAPPVLVCTLCACGYHAQCVRPSLSPRRVPRAGQEWHCPTCSNHAMDFFTCWIPVGRLGPRDGRLAVVPSSHLLTGYECPSQGQLLPRAFSTPAQQRVVWHAPARMDMGDIIVFNIKTVHAATQHHERTFRLSIDTRITRAPPPRIAAADAAHTQGAGEEETH